MVQPKISCETALCSSAEELVLYTGAAIPLEVREANVAKQAVENFIFCLMQVLIGAFYCINAYTGSFNSICLLYIELKTVNEMML